MTLEGYTREDVQAIKHTHKTVVKAFENQVQGLKEKAEDLRHRVTQLQAVVDMAVMDAGVLYEHESGGGFVELQLPREDWQALKDAASQSP